MTGGRFRPTWRLTLFTAVFVPILCSLSVWQWQRADQKAEIETRQLEQAALAPVPIRPDAQPLPADMARVLIRGQIRTDRIVLRDNRTHEGRVGYQVYAPVVPADPDARHEVLVDFGWVQAPPERDQLPHPVLPAGPVRIVGTLDTSLEEGVTFGPVSEGDRWPRRVQRIDLDSLGKALDTELYAGVLIADEDMPGAQTYNWTAVRMTSARHRAYSVQWFGLASVLLLGWLIASLRQPSLRQPALRRPIDAQDDAARGADDDAA